MRPMNDEMRVGTRFVRTIMMLWLAVAGNTAWGQAAPDIKDPSDVPTLQANFAGASLEDVMKEYGEMTGLTPLIHPAVAARNVKITWQSRAKLTKKQYLEGIMIMLTYNGIALVPYNKKFVKVVAVETARAVGIDTQMTAPDEPMGDSDAIVSRVISLKNMEITEAIKVIDALRSVTGKVQPLERINSVLLTDSAANINRILEMLDHMDQPIETKEQFFIKPVRFMKASDIKTKLDDLVKDLTDKTSSTPTVAKPSPVGPPSMIQPGVIRASRIGPVPVDSGAGSDAEVEKGMVRGRVKIIADDRTGILIFITLPSNMKFFDQVVQALDKDVKFVPDVLVKVYRMEFADANEVGTMLNTLIGAVTKKDAAAATPGAPKTQPPMVPTTSPTSSPLGVSTLEQYVNERPAADGEHEGVSAARKTKVGELSADNVKILPDKRTNGLIVMASKADQETIGELIKQMDMMLSQVLIEAVIIKIELSDSLKTGVQWLQNAMTVYDKKNGKLAPVGAFAGTFGGGTDSQGAGGLPAPADASGVTALPGAAGLSYYLTHYGLNINAVIQMASSDGKTKVVSTPVILTTDNTEATLKVMDQVYVSNGQVLTQVGSYTQPIENFTIRDIGIELKVKPHINTNKVVMMEISQSVSDPGAVGAPQAGAKVSSTRSLNASIAVRDGETIILGGQVRQDQGETRFKVPILGDIPLLGRLFNSTSESGGRTEMIVLITPYVLDTPGSISAESRRRTRAMDLQRIWLRGERQWSDSKLAEPTRAQARLEAREAKDRARAEKAEDARIAAEEKKAAAEAKKHSEAEARAIEAEDEAAKKQENEVTAEKTKSKPKVNPVLLELMSRQESEWSEQLKAVDKATVPPDGAGQ